MKDDLGNRMKSNYENRFRVLLPRRTNVIIRVDGKAFHTYTRNCHKPFDFELMFAMDETATALCKNIQGAKLAYVQSDEISIWVTDYDALETCAWFDNNLQKMVSVAASVATAEFNKTRASTARRAIEAGEQPEVAHFDARAFIIPDLTEVANYFLWRCQDATRNSVQMVARYLFSHKECENKSTKDLKMMIETKKSGGWEGIGPECKHGRIIRKSSQQGQYGVIDRWSTYGVINCEFNYWHSYLQTLLPKSLT